MKNLLVSDNRISKIRDKCINNRLTQEQYDNEIFRLECISEQNGLGFLAALIIFSIGIFITQTVDINIMKPLSNGVTLTDGYVFKQFITIFFHSVFLALLYFTALYVNVHYKLKLMIMRQYKDNIIISSNGNTTS